MSQQNITWKCRKSSTKVDQRIRLVREEVSNHPLQRFSNKNRTHTTVEKPTLLNQPPVQSTNKFTYDAMDPLDRMLEGNDPLSMFQKQAQAQAEDEDDELDNSVTDNVKFRGLESWNSKKESMLSKFNSSEILTMTSCFSLQDKGTSLLKGKPNRPDDYEDGIIFEINDIHPQDYCRRIDKFHKEVIRAWNEDQRVRALKIVIQCSKLLSDSYAYWFYPVKYCHITEILDTFGDLVYQRLKEKCVMTGYNQLFGKNLKKFPDNFTLDMVPDAAQETCHNWFYKIASIRELIPRLYVELALLRSYAFITSGKNGEILRRISEMINGVGDPIVSMYLRCYVCRVALKFGAEDYKFFNDNFESVLQMTAKIYASCKNLRLTLEFPKYVESCMPPMQWMFQGILSGVSDLELDNVHSQWVSYFDEDNDNAILLYLLLTASKPYYIATNGPKFLKLIGNANHLDVPVYKLLLNLGRNYEEFMKENPCNVQPAVIKDIWPMINYVDSGADYMLVVDQWIPLSMPHFTAAKVDDLFTNVQKYLAKGNFTERMYAQLESVIRNLSDGIEDFTSLVITESLLPFLNLFRSETSKVNVCKIMMEAFVKRSNETFVNDTVVLNNIMHIARILHDSINALAVEDEKKQISNLISTFVRRIDFGRDFEQLLDFYVEARGTFYNLDVVHATLVQCVNKLAFETLKVVKGRHTSKTSDFVRACAAYSFITIPSITSPLTRLQLYIISCQTTLANQCLGQADAYFKAIIDTVADVPKVIGEKGEEKHTQNILIPYIKEFMSILLVAPDNPSDDGSLVLVRTLANVVKQYAWEEPNYVKIHLFVNILHLLSVEYQDYYPYHFFNVDSNDILYASDLQFREEVETISTVLLKQILTHLKLIGDSEEVRKQAELAIELFMCIMLRADIRSIDVAKLSINLWNLANKHNYVDKTPALNIVKYCLRSSEPDSEYAEMYSKLLSKFE
ncbi:VPS35 endosomal protein-sorting factor-like [Planococcus citri]|uniref:VPS35 endosomal protein-sorting factor-like n=1 Tax=Planococcus citri TaxID=170843 RepID=UPI0031F7A695